MLLPFQSRCWLLLSSNYVVSLNRDGFLVPSTGLDSWFHQQGWILGSINRDGFLVPSTGMDSLWGHAPLTFKLSSSISNHVVPSTDVALSIFQPSGFINRCGSFHLPTIWFHQQVWLFPSSNHLISSTGVALSIFQACDSINRFHQQVWLLLYSNWAIPGRAPSIFQWHVCPSKSVATTFQPLNSINGCSFWRNFEGFAN